MSAEVGFLPEGQPGTGATLLSLFLKTLIYLAAAGRRPGRWICSLSRHRAGPLRWERGVSGADPALLSGTALLAGSLLFGQQVPCRVLPSVCLGLPCGDSFPGLSAPLQSRAPGDRGPSWVLAAGAPCPAQACLPRGWEAGPGCLCLVGSAVPEAPSPSRKRSLQSPTVGAAQGSGGRPLPS